MLYVDPITKMKRQKVDFWWQKAGAQRILVSLENCTESWTTSAVQKRESLDKSDSRDQASSLFMLDKFAAHLANAEILRALYVAPRASASAATVLAAASALALAQDAAISALVADVNSPVVESDRIALAQYCELTGSELNLYKEFVRVYDTALCHFLFDIVADRVGRFLNAERVQKLNGITPVVLKWSDYTTLLLDMLRDGSKSNDLLAFFHKTRENGLTVPLWVAERRAERSLLEKDQVSLPEETWMEYVLHFVPPEEKQHLDVPSAKDRKTHNAGAGYTLADLETSIATADVDSFKRFNQKHCTDPLAKRLLAIEVALKDVDRSVFQSKKGKRGEPSLDPKKINLANEKGEPRKRISRFSDVKPLTGAALLLLDKKASLPSANGSPDTAKFRAKYNDKSLRSKVWDRIVDGHCVRCGSSHVRKNCSVARAIWEDDFDKGACFWDPPPAKQHRSQWNDSPSACLTVRTRHGIFGIDTQSDISTVLPAFATNIRSIYGVRVHHISGSTVLDTLGTVKFSASIGASSIPPVSALIVSPDQLPPGLVGILGIEEIVTLKLSLDYVTANPSCDLTAAIRATWPSLLPREDRVFELPREAYWEYAKPDPFIVESDTDSDLPNLLAISDTSSDDTVERLANDPRALQAAYFRRYPEQLIDTESEPPCPVDPPAQLPAFMLSVFLAVLLLLTSAVQLGVGHRHRDLSGQALLPGAPSSGHSLFDQPPYSTSSDIVWVPSFLFAVQDNSTSNGCLPSEPPEIRVCFMQHVQRQPFAPASSFVGGTALRATIDILPEGLQVPVSIVAGIDTQSDVSLATRDLLSDIHAIAPDDIHGVGQSVTFNEMGFLDLLTEGRMTRVPALVARPDHLPSRCSALLGMPAILELGIKLDEQKDHQDAPLICHLGEKSLRVWWDANEGQSIDTKPFDTSSIDVNPQMEAKCRDIILAAIAKYSVVFEGSAATLPKPFDTPPIELNFKPDAMPQSIPEPRWPHAYGKIVQKWAEDGLANGSLEHSTSAWASRAHIVLKAPAGIIASLANIAECKLRVTGDYRMVNSQIAKLVPNLPTGTHQLERASGHRFYFESDSVACYNSFRLAAGRSREALAIWTPGVGKITIIITRRDSN